MLRIESLNDLPAGIRERNRGKFADDLAASQAPGLSKQPKPAAPETTQGRADEAVAVEKDGRMTRPKYGNKKTEVDGILFDSKVEAARWVTLRRAEESGLICYLKRQYAFVLAPSVKLLGEKRTRPAIRYVADFVYKTPHGSDLFVEDVKGFDTPMSRLKRHLMKTVRGLDVVIIK